MKRTCLVVLAAAFTAQVSAQTDLDIPEIKAYSTKLEAIRNSWQQEAETMKTVDIYKELERLDSAWAARMALHPESWWLSLTDDDLRSSTLNGVLSSRRDKGEVAASFYLGVRGWKWCQALQKRDTGQFANKEAADCWSRILDSFKVASAAQVPAATFNIARMYEHGFGVIASKYAAADWYFKSAKQYKKAGSRDQALTSLKAALTVVPDHPAALRLRKVMLK